MPETNYAPNLGEIFSIPPEADDGSGSSSSSGGDALPTTGDPEGVLTANNNQFAWDSTNKVLYIHEGADGTNTGWREIIA